VSRYPFPFEQTGDIKVTDGNLKCYLDEETTMRLLPLVRTLLLGTTLALVNHLSVNGATRPTPDEAEQTTKVVEDYEPFSILVCKAESDSIATLDAYDNGGDKEARKFADELEASNRCEYFHTLKIETSHAECRVLKNGHCVSVQQAGIFDIFDPDEVIVERGYLLVEEKSKDRILPPLTEIMKPERNIIFVAY